MTNQKKEEVLTLLSRENNKRTLEEKVDWSKLGLESHHLEKLFGPPPGNASYLDNKFVNGVLLYLYTIYEKITETKISRLPAGYSPVEGIDSITSRVKEDFDKIAKIQRKIEEYFHKKSINFCKDFQSCSITITPPADPRFYPKKYSGDKRK